MGYLILALLLLWGVLMFWKPELMWKLEHAFSVLGGEPTDRYIAMTRIGGVVCAVIAVLFAIKYLF